MADQMLARECFVIMPFGEKPYTDAKQVATTMDFDVVYREIIKPAVEDDLRRDRILISCLRCDEIEAAGLIHERMIHHILDAQVAVVDITTMNPNVFYELGVRHALRDRVTVLMRRAGTQIPFNIGGMSVIEYDLGKEQIEKARKAIANFIRNGLVSSNRDSLVYAMIPGLEVSAGQGAIAVCEVYRYALPKARGKEICLVTGDLRNVNVNWQLADQPIDIWVSSENINMQMARIYDKSVSGLVRYLGARKDDTGDVVEDSIADELRAKMRGRQQVNPGAVVASSSGALLHTHQVRRIYHAAAVYGTIGGGYHAIAQVEQCITAALVLADHESEPAEDTTVKPYTSILFPLLGAAAVSGHLVDHAKKQLGAAIAYLSSRASVTRVQRACFLAPTTTALAACQLALAEMGLAQPTASSAAAPAAAVPVAGARGARKPAPKSPAAERVVTKRRAAAKR